MWTRTGELIYNMEGESRFRIKNKKVVECDFYAKISRDLCSISRPFTSGILRCFVNEEFDTELYFTGLDNKQRKIYAKILTVFLKCAKNLFFSDLVRHLKTIPNLALINVDFFNKSNVDAQIADIYINEIVKFQCTSVYFLATVGYSWTIVFKNGTESANPNVFVKGTGYTLSFFALVNRKINFTVNLVILQNTLITNLILNH